MSSGFKLFERFRVENQWLSIHPYCEMQDTSKVFTKFSLMHPYGYSNTEAYSTLELTEKYSNTLVNESEKTCQLRLMKSHFLKSNYFIIEIFVIY